MIVPHSTKSTFSVSFPIPVLRLIGGLLVGVAAVAIFATIYSSLFYRQIKLGAKELSVKATENQILQEQLNYFVNKTSDLEDKMQDLEKLDNDLRSLLKDDPVLKKSLEPTAAARRLSLSDRGQMTRERAVKDLSRIETELSHREDSLKELREAVMQRNKRLASTPSIRPLNGRITSCFGYRNSPIDGRREFHNGLDIAAPYGSPVKAAAGGRITWAGYQSGYGNMVTINHGYGIETSYGHNAVILVQVGEQVQKEQIIAKVGNTGRSTGPHLHYMVRVNGIAEDPAKYLE
jgi:murein DD-endopeptidase MepM/ murein hydrolase activator NlpD